MTQTVNSPDTGGKRKRKRSGKFLLSLALLLITAGLLLIMGTVFFPDQTEKAAGQVRVTTGQWVMQARGQEHPIVRLGGKGAKELLDRCDGTFTEMTSYETEGLQPVFAAHNNCKGEVILPLAVGDVIEVKDRGLYEIVDERHTKKTWSTTKELLGMDGDFILQTCFWGENRMKFIGLSSVAAANEDAS